jgi:dihydrofolate synthase/folylpolyglutamate synthase
MTYSAALDWLYGLQVHGIKLGLDNMRRLCEALEIDTQSSEKRRFIHIAGTNGKGSVCAMIAAILCSMGERTGLYTSPHLATFRERIRVGRNLIPAAHVTEGLERIRDATATWEHVPTFFEVTTALALDWFQRQNARWVVLETGLGGRLDATNVVTPAVSVITPIGLDHTKYLGDTIAAIAGEKAGIIKRGVKVISAPQDPDAADVIAKRAAELGSPLSAVTKPVADCEIALPGSHQRMNAATAFAAVIAAGLRPSPAAVFEALRNVEWPGRFQRVRDGQIVLDGAHNPHAAQTLAATWREVFDSEQPLLIFGAMADKDVDGVCAALAPIASEFACVAVNNPRSEKPDTLAAKFRTLRLDAPVGVYGSVADAIAAAGKKRMLIAGSLFLIGEALVALGLAEPDGRITTQ